MELSEAVLEDRLYWKGPLTLNKNGLDQQKILGGRK